VVLCGQGVSHGAAGEPVRRTLAARPVDILEDTSAFQTGGLLLLGARTSNGAPSLAALRELRRTYPHVLVFVCANRDSHVHGMLARYTVAGLDDLFTIQSPADLADLVRVVSKRVLTPPPVRALQALPGLGLESLPTRVAMHAFRNACGATGMTGVAARFGRSLRTVEAWCQAQGLPSLSDLCRCGRYLHLLELDRRGVRSTAEQAVRLGFGKPGNLRQWVWRLRERVRASAELRRFASRLEDLQPVVGEEDWLHG